MEIMSDTARAVHNTRLARLEALGLDTTKPSKTFSGKALTEMLPKYFSETQSVEFEKWFCEVSVANAEMIEADKEALRAKFRPPGMTAPSKISAWDAMGIGDPTKPRIGSETGTAAAAEGSDWRVLKQRKDSILATQEKALQHNAGFL